MTTCPNCGYVEKPTSKPISNVMNTYCNEKDKNIQVVVNGQAETIIFKSKVEGKPDVKFIRIDLWDKLTKKVNTPSATVPTPLNTSPATPPPNPVKESK